MPGGSAAHPVREDGRDGRDHHRPAFHRGQPHGGAGLGRDNHRRPAEEGSDAAREPLAKLAGDREVKRALRASDSVARRYQDLLGAVTRTCLTSSSNEQAPDDAASGVAKRVHMQVEGAGVTVHQRGRRQGRHSSVSLRAWP